MKEKKFTKELNDMQIGSLKWNLNGKIPLLNLALKHALNIGTKII